MKHINLVIALLFLSFFVGCEDDGYDAPNEFSDVAWYNSIYPGKPYNVELGGYISFMDLSQGSLSHEWSIELNNHFLKPGFKDTDSLPLFIDPKMGLTTANQTVHILFMNQGLNKVHFRNTFKDSVSYKGTKKLHPKKEGNVWVIDTTFMVDVFVDLKPAFKVFKGDQEALSISEDDMPKIEDKATWPTVEVEAGDALKFVDMTKIDRPNGRGWILNGGKPTTSTDSVATISYFSLGEYEAGQFRSIRSGDRPETTVWKTIPMKVKVIPSSKPFVFIGNLKEAVNETISFNITGEAVPFSGQEGFFTVHVTNPNGFNANIPVASAKVNDTDATIIDLKLSKPIYSTDAITVSYSGGTIKSVDTRNLGAFTDQKVATYLDASILDKSGYGFENIGAGWWIQHTAYWSSSDAVVHSGFYSFKFTNTNVATAPGTMITFGPKPGLVKAGDYLVRAKIYKVPGCTVTSFNFAFEKKWVRKTIEFGYLPEGKWVTASEIFTQPEDRADEGIFIDVNGPVIYGGGTGTFYIDDIECIPLEKRI